MGGTHRIIQSGYRKASAQLLRIFNNSFEGHSFKDKTKTWVRIYAYRPDFKSDIQNFEECICDALKEALQIDDRYFSLIIDWELNRKTPIIHIDVWQE
jgi:small-conductance mechanosensitive channel